MSEGDGCALSAPGSVVQLASPAVACSSASSGLVSAIGAAAVGSGGVFATLSTSTRVDDVTAETAPNAFKRTWTVQCGCPAVAPYVRLKRILNQGTVATLSAVARFSVRRERERTGSVQACTQYQRSRTERARSTNASCTKGREQASRLSTRQSTWVFPWRWPGGGAPAEHSATQSCRAKRHGSRTRDHIISARERSARAGSKGQRPRAAMASAYHCPPGRVAHDPEDEAIVRPKPLAPRDMQRP